MTDAADVVAFWREAGPQAWFAKNEAFDNRFRAAFTNAHEAAVRGELADWEETPEGALALIEAGKEAFSATHSVLLSTASSLIGLLGVVVFYVWQGHVKRNGGTPAGAKE